MPPSPEPSAPNAWQTVSTTRVAQRTPSVPLLLGLLVLWLLATLGLRPLLLPDEGRYANVAREMLLGNALVPTLNGLPFFHKPPLFYWLDMAAMQVFGLNAFAARCGAMLGAWLMGASLYFAVRRWHGSAAAVRALAILATCPLFFISAQYANHDLLVAGLITAAVCSLVRAVDQPPGVHQGWLVAGAVACAFAVLAKGLIGIVLPVLVIGPWLLAQRRWAQLLGLLHPLGLLAFLAVAGPWFVWVQWHYPGFFDYFVMEQHVRRFAMTTFNNVQPFWFFVAVLPALSLPWALWSVPALRRAGTGWDARYALYLWWVVVVVGFFSLPSSKIVGYVLPAMAPWCALLTWPLMQLKERRWKQLLGASAVVCLAITLGLAWQAPRFDRTVAHRLAADMAPGDRVVMVDDYFYDIPFYTRLTQPVTIASDWADPDLPRRDNWRKELFDAVRFDPRQGAALLRPLDAMAPLLCGSGTVWFLARPAQAHRVAQLTGSTRVLATRGVELWGAAAHACP